MRFTLHQKDGRYSLNGIPYKDLSNEEQIYYNQALKDMKLLEAVKKHVSDPNFDNPISQLNKSYK